MTRAIQVSDRLYATFQWRAHEMGVTVQELVLEAVSLWYAVNEVRKSGCRLLVERKGYVKELVLDDTLISFPGPSGRLVASLAVMDLLTMVMGDGDDEASRLIRQHQQALRRTINENWCRKVIHGEEPCDCPGDVCLGIVLFA